MSGKRRVGRKAEAGMDSAQTETVFCFVLFFQSSFSQVSHEFAINFNPTNPFCSGESSLRHKRLLCTPDSLIKSPAAFNSAATFYS